MRYVEARKVQVGSVVTSTVRLDRAGRLAVPAGCQGVVQEVTHEPFRGCYVFLVKWNLSTGENMTLKIDSMDVRLMPDSVRC